MIKEFTMTYENVEHEVKIELEKGISKKGYEFYYVTIDGAVMLECMSEEEILEMTMQDWIEILKYM